MVLPALAAAQARLLASSAVTKAATKTKLAACNTLANNQQPSRRVPRGGIPSGALRGTPATRRRAPTRTRKVVGRAGFGSHCHCLPRPASHGTTSTEPTGHRANEESRRELASRHDRRREGSPPNAAKSTVKTTTQRQDGGHAERPRGAGGPAVAAAGLHLPVEVAAQFYDAGSARGQAAAAAAAPPEPRKKARPD